MIDENDEDEVRIHPSVFYDQFQATVTPRDLYLNCIDLHIWFEDRVSGKASVIVVQLCLGKNRIVALINI